MLKNFEPENVISWCQNNGLIHATKECDCGHEMSLQNFASDQDGKTWRCAKCKKRKSIRAGTFFSKSHLSMSTILHLTFDFVTEVPVSTSSSFNGVTEKTAVQWYQYGRDIMSTMVLRLNHRLGGVDHEVQVDETLMFKRKNNVGRTVQQH